MPERFRSASVPCMQSSKTSECCMRIFSTYERSLGMEYGLVAMVPPGWIEWQHDCLLSWVWRLCWWRGQTGNGARIDDGKPAVTGDLVVVSGDERRAVGS